MIPTKHYHNTEKDGRTSDGRAAIASAERGDGVGRLLRIASDCWAGSDAEDGDAIAFLVGTLSQVACLAADEDAEDMRAAAAAALRTTHGHARRNARSLVHALKARVMVHHALRLWARKRKTRVLNPATGKE